MRATLARGYGVDLVDDHRARGLEHGPARLGAEQDIEGLRRGHHDVRRKLGGTLALSLRWIAGAHPRADHDIGQSPRAKLLADAVERNVKIAMDVVGESLQRRDIDDLRFVLEPAVETLANETINGAEESGKCLAGASRRGDQH